MDSLKQWINDHPTLAFWIALAIGMNIIVIFAARSVGLTAVQWFWLFVINTLVAGLMAWIVNFGDDEDEEGIEL